MKKRKYTQSRRLAQSEDTRSRIVEATMALHETVGPAETTIKAIAERAGVQRLTVYRHFPDENALFNACTSHWISLHPLPETSDRSSISDPAQRAAAAMRRFYDYYEQTATMWRSAWRDAGRVAALEAPMAAITAHLARVRDDLASDLATDPAHDEAVRATIGHALAFSTFETLRNEGLRAEGMASLVCRWIDAARGNC